MQTGCKETQRPWLKIRQERAYPWEVTRGLWQPQQAPWRASCMAHGGWKGVSWRCISKSGVSVQMWHVSPEGCKMQQEWHPPLISLSPWHISAASCHTAQGELRGGIQFKLHVYWLSYKPLGEHHLLQIPDLLMIFFFPPPCSHFNCRVYVIPSGTAIATCIIIYAVKTKLMAIYLLTPCPGITWVNSLILWL